MPLTAAGCSRSCEPTHSHGCPARISPQLARSLLLQLPALRADKPARKLAEDLHVHGRAQARVRACRQAMQAAQCMRRVLRLQH